MGDVARLVGIEIREYEKDGRKQRFCGLHLMYVEGSQDGVQGSKVETVTCPRDVSPSTLDLNQLYELQYQIYSMKGQKMARLVGLEPVEEE